MSAVNRNAARGLRRLGLGIGLVTLLLWASGCGIQPLLYQVNPTREYKVSEDEDFEYNLVGHFKNRSIAIFALGFPIKMPSVRDLVDLQINNMGGDRVTNLTYSTSDINIAQLANFVIVTVEGDVLAVKE